ncbi:MAG: nitroreductase family protein [Firmicutes bacterium]|nr:nitroreductase family protein [Bacillota bacterium]
MEISTAIQERRSIRSYENRPIPEEDLQAILKAAILAPSAGNRQPWFFYVVKDREVRAKLGEAALGQNFILEAPVAIVVCADFARSAERYKERGTNLYCLQDTAAAIQNMLLTAQGRGLGTCWVGAFNEARVADLLSVPTDRMRPVAIIPIGYPGTVPVPRPRRPLEEVVKVV